MPARIPRVRRPCDPATRSAIMAAERGLISGICLAVVAQTGAREAAAAAAAMRRSCMVTPAGAARYDRGVRACVCAAARHRPRSGANLRCKDDSGFRAIGDHFSAAPRRKPRFCVSACRRTVRNRRGPQFGAAWKTYQAAELTYEMSAARRHLLGSTTANEWEGRHADYRPRWIGGRMSGGARGVRRLVGKRPVIGVPGTRESRDRKRRGGCIGASQ